MEISVSKSPIGSTNHQWEMEEKSQGWKFHFIRRLLINSSQRNVQLMDLNQKYDKIIELLEKDKTK